MRFITTSSFYYFCDNMFLAHSYSGDELFDEYGFCIDPFPIAMIMYGDWYIWDDRVI